ncbi:hypothetical protein BU17DRAFT_95237 [Hysterangium stoloniferum]|nr:hypothetical protein BU17DRAFT_95237 [Hysterangium stoloniferum]
MPHELYDMIIDFLHDDTPALCIAGLVCKQWLPAARFHLFSNTRLAPFNVHNALAVICSAGSTIPPHILHLEIEDDETQYLDEALLRLPPLSNLMSLSLGKIDWTSLSTGAKKRLSTILQNLTTLCLNYPSFESVDQAFELIASAPSLENLLLWSVNYDDSCNYSPQDRAPPLKRIQFDADPFTSNLMDWFCRCHPTPNVHTFMVSGISVNDIPAVCGHIRHLGSALKNIAISCPGFDKIGTAQTLLSKQIDLTQNTSLRNISFDSIILYADSPGSRSCDWIIHIISQIPHRSLESVTLNIFLGNLEEINSINLPALDILFLNPVLSSNSTKLCFMIRGGVDRDAARAMIKDGLRELDGRGRLEFNVMRF